MMPRPMKPILAIVYFSRVSDIAVEAALSTLGTKPRKPGFRRRERLVFAADPTLVVEFVDAAEHERIHWSFPDVHGSAPVRESLRRLFLGGPHVLALLDRKIWVQAEDFFKLVHAVDLRPHRDVGDALKDELEHDRNLIFLHELVGAGEGGLELVWALDADGLAAEALGDRHGVDAGARHSGALR